MIGKEMDFYGLLKKKKKLGSQRCNWVVESLPVLAGTKSWVRSPVLRKLKSVCLAPAALSKPVDVLAPTSDVPLNFRSYPESTTA